MTTWTYFGPGAGSQEGWPGTTSAPRGADIVTVGKRELEMLLRARRSSSKSVIIPHTKERNAERLALRRLCERKLFSWPNGMGAPWWGWLYRYNLTERGRAVWLRCAR